MSSEIDYTKGEPMEFTIEKEYWEKFKLDDDTILHARVVATKFIRLNMYDPSGQPSYSYSPIYIASTYAPKKNRGKPFAGPLSPNLADHKTHPVDFQRVGEEKWNIYKLDDGTFINTKLEISSVFKTDKFTSDGDPYYIVNFAALMRQRVPQKLFKR